MTIARTFVIWHFRETDGTYTAKCFAFKQWRTTAATLEENKTKAEASLREHIAASAEIRHFENVPMGKAA